MNNAIFNFDNPQNEAILDYAPGSYERELLVRELKNLESVEMDKPEDH